MCKKKNENSFFSLTSTLSLQLILLLIIAIIITYTAYIHFEQQASEGDGNTQLCSFEGHDMDVYGVFFYAIVPQFLMSIHVKIMRIVIFFWEKFPPSRCNFLSS